jgi:hypothetical protein
MAHSTMESLSDKPLTEDATDKAVVERNLMQSTLTEQGHAIGGCQKCGAGIAFAGKGVGSIATCPNCNAKVKLSFVYGNKSAKICDGACMGAVGPSCSCACGGINHGRWFLPIEIVATWAPEEQAKAKAAREKRVTDFADRTARKRQAKEDKEREGRERLLAEYPSLTLLADKEWFDEHAAWSRFMEDMRNALLSGNMSERQANATVATVFKLEEKRKAKLIREAQQAKLIESGVTVQTGRHQFEGEIVNAVEKLDQYSYTESYIVKITVQLDDGTKVWGTLPKSLFHDEHVGQYGQGDYEKWFNALRGRRIKMTATVKPSDRDQTFGFYSRPSKVEFL